MMNKLCLWIGRITLVGLTISIIYYATQHCSFFTGHNIVVEASQVMLVEYKNGSRKYYIYYYDENGFERREQHIKCDEFVLQKGQTINIHKHWVPVLNYAFPVVPNK